MAVVKLDIGERQFNVACREGGEARLRQAGALVADRWADAERAAGNGGGFRVMLFAALMLADTIIDRDAAIAAAAVPDERLPDAALERIADRLGALAAALEAEGPAGASLAAETLETKEPNA